MNGIASLASVMMADRTDPEHGSWVREAVARFEGPLALYATRLLGDPEAAHDVVQDAFLRLCARTALRSGITWPNGSSRSAATGLWMFCGRSIA